MNFKILLTLGFLSLGVLNLHAQSYPDSLYNDDPHQKLPLGAEEPDYGLISPEGKEVQEARVEPPFWWIGMKNPVVQVLIYDNQISRARVSVDYPGVQLKDIHRVENPNYLFVDLEIQSYAKAGNFDITLEKEGSSKNYTYELRNRREGSADRQGVDAGDFIYLIMPDRFANGDPSNDSFDDMNQWGVHREKALFRHGGDLIGVMEHLDYLEDLGVTALWLNPVLENDEPYESYHGYAPTEHYLVDKRLGTNEQYLTMVNLCHERGMKVIKDVIYNHVGDKHWFIEDLPASDWIHQFESFTKTTYRAPTLMDPYASESDKDLFLNGWFDRHMPDLNQKHPLLANYLIQNTVWWIEYADLDGLRIDTYAYSDQDFMAELGKVLQHEYPDFSFFGETWVHGTPIQAQFTQGNELRDGYNSYLPGVTDYQMYYAIMDALSKEQGWTDGVTKIYYTLAKDFLYEAPLENVLFLDNHDLTRFYTAVNEDMDKFKSGMAMLLTMRGIPMINYGTEILLVGSGGGFGEGGRKDFPGGWKGDPVYKFNPAFHEADEQEAFEYVKTLANYRKNTPALQDGKLKQYIPENGVYVYFRYDDQQKVMVVSNTHTNTANLHMERFKKDLKGYKSAKNVLTGEVMDQLSNLKIAGHTTLVLELQK
jgi:glycosidase